MNQNHFYAVKIGMSMNLTDLVQNTDNWQALVNTVVNLPFP